MVTASAIRTSPASACNRKRGGTPSSNTWSTIDPGSGREVVRLGVVMLIIRMSVTVAVMMMNAPA